MCLEIVLKGKEKKAALAELKDTIVVWKVLNKPFPEGGCDYYTTDCQNFHVYAGEVVFKQNTIGGTWGEPKYRGGGHFWLTKAGVLDWDDCDDYEGGCEIVRCIIKKSDINTIGVQRYPVVVVKKATFPKHIGKKK